MTSEIAKFYKTAKAVISCAKFKAGEYVAVKYSWTDANGTNWFDINHTENGALAQPVAYPENHLTAFCL